MKLPPDPAPALPDPILSDLASSKSDHPDLGVCYSSAFPTSVLRPALEGASTAEPGGEEAEVQGEPSGRSRPVLQQNRFAHHAARLPSSSHLLSFSDPGRSPVAMDSPVKENVTRLDNFPAFPQLLSSDDSGVGPTTISLVGVRGARLPAAVGWCPVQRHPPRRPAAGGLGDAVHLPSHPLWPFRTITRVAVFKVSKQRCSGDAAVSGAEPRPSAPPVLWALTQLPLPGRSSSPLTPSTSSLQDGSPYLLPPGPMGPSGSRHPACWGPGGGLVTINT